MLMDRHSLISNTMVAFLAQGFVMLLSAMQILLVPKVLGVEQYGFWQLFLLYATYVGFFPLGLNDGVYLRNGGKTRDEVDKRSIFSQMLFGLTYETPIAAVVILVAIFGGFNQDREIIIACTGIYIVLQNLVNFMVSTFQAMNEIKRASYARIVERAVFLVPLVILLLAHVQSFIPLVYAYLFAAVVQLMYCLFFFRDFISCGFEGFGRATRDGLTNIRIGIKLMIANIASMLIIGIGQFTIDAAWGIETFGKLSLALSLMNFVLVFVSQVGMVLFPALRQATPRELSRFYLLARDAIGLFFPAVYLLYFPITIVLQLWLPDYANSFIFLAYLIPICIFDSKMNITCTTFFKVCRKEKLLMLINLGTVALSITGAFVGAFVIKSVYAVIGAMVISVVLRSLVSEQLVRRELELKDSGTFAWEVLLSLVFVVSTTLLPGIASFGIFFVVYASYIALHHKRMGELVRTMRNAK